MNINSPAFIANQNWLVTALSRSSHHEVKPEKVQVFKNAQALCDQHRLTAAAAAADAVAYLKPHHISGSSQLISSLPCMMNTRPEKPERRWLAPARCFLAACMTTAMTMTLKTLLDAACSYSITTFYPSFCLVDRTDGDSFPLVPLATSNYFGSTVGPLSVWWERTEQ